MTTGAVLIGCGFMPTQVEIRHALDGGYIKNCQVVRTISSDDSFSVEMALSIYTGITDKHGWTEPRGGLEVVQFTTRSGQRVWSIYPLEEKGQLEPNFSQTI